MDSTMDTLVIQIQSSSKSATESINTLVDSLKKLRTELKNVVDESKNLSSLKVNLPSVGVRSSLQKKASVQPMSREDALKEIKVSGELTPLSTLKKSDQTQLQKYKDAMGGIVTVTKKVKNGVESFTASVKQSNPHITTFSEKIEGLKSVFSSAQVKMAGFITGFVTLANKVGDFVEQAGAEQEALNLFTVTMGKYAKQGVDWIEKFSEALYLDPVGVMQYMGSFNSLVKGLGVGAENSYKMSKNLTQLVYDLSSFKNISIESAYEKLMSGISGELEPLRNVGVAMSEATLQTLAYSLGIDKLVRNMTEAEKAQLRYIQIMRSTSEWQTDMGRTIVTPSNALRVMKQQFIQLGRAIGKIFIPIIMEAMPYVIAITQLLTALANKIANFLGYKIADIDYSSLGEISAGITDIGTSADKTTEKLNTMLAPFDDLNVVQTESKSGGSGSGLGGVGGDLGVPLPEYDALANLNEKFAKGVEEAKAKLKSLLPLVIAIGTALALWKIGSTVLNTINSILNASELLSKITPMTSARWSKILGGGLLLAIATIIGTIGVGLGWSAIKDALEKNGWDNNNFLKFGIASGLVVITGFIAGVGIALMVGATAMTGGLIGIVIAGAVVLLSLLVSTIAIYWDKIKKGFSNFIKNVGKAWTDFWVSLGDKVDKELQEVADNYLAFEKFILEFWDVMVDVAKQGWNDFINWFKNGFNSLKNWFNETKSSISKVWSETWTNVKDTAKTKWTDTKTWLSNNIGNKETWKNRFKGILDGASNILSELKKKFENWSAKIKTPHISWSSEDSYKTSGVVKKALEALNLPTSIPKLKVSWYQDGGYPTSGDLFFANENGVPEMVGQIGNQTAVANNDQITTSITNALISALNQYDFGGGKAPTTIYIGNRKVYEGYGDYMAEENDRYGTNMIKI